MQKIIAIILLLNIQVYHTQSYIIPQTSDSISIEIPNDLESSTIRSYSTSTPASTSTAMITISTTEAPSLLSTIKKRIWNIFDFGGSSKAVTTTTTSTTAAPFPTTDMDDGVEVKTMKITFAGRTHFRVRNNCPCMVHGRCARSNVCH